MMLINHSILNIPINEVYFGKSKELLEMENVLNNIRNKYMGKFSINPVVNNDPDILKFNRMVEDFFGFGCFALTVINVPQVNAFTAPIDYRIDVLNTKSKLVVDKRTFKFKKEADYACLVYIYSGLIFNDAYSTEEVMAFIIHEIGHNFFSALNSKYGILIKFFIALDIINKLYQIVLNPTNLPAVVKNIVNATNLYQKLVTRFKLTLRDNESILIIIHDYVKMASQLGTTAIGSIIKFIDVITLGIPSLGLSLAKAYAGVMNPASYLLMMLPYSNERGADNFCTMYGYGPALSSGLEKMSNFNTTSPSNFINTFNKIPVVSNLYAINSQLSRIILTAFDEHPTELSRAADQLAMLEREAAKADIDPKMKKVILNDCKAIKNKINVMIGYNNSIDNKNMVRSAYFRSLYESSDSKGFKDMLFDDINKFDTYDKTYNEKIK